MTDQYVQVQPNSTGLKIDTSEVVVGANTVERQRMVLADPVYSAGFATVNPLGSLSTSAEPRQLFYDTFDTGLNTIARWKTPVASGTGAVAATNVAGSGSTTLTGGSATNAYSLLESQPVFQSTAPGSIFVTLYLTIEYPVLTTGYRFWGLGVTPATPTISAPMTDACGFEITTAGKLMAVTYASGSRNQIADLSSSGTNTQPADANPHKYLIWFKGDTMYWSIDTASNVVASSTGALGPVNHDLPVKFLAVSNSGTVETIVVDGCSVGDTACNNTQLSDGDYPWNQGSIHDDGGLQISTGQPWVEQGISATSSGSVASLTATFAGTNFSGNTIIVTCGVGNTTAPTVTDSQGNTYTRASNVASAAHNVSVFYAANVLSGSRNTVTVNNGGTTASIAMHCYEVDGLLTFAPAILDVTATNNATGTAASTSALVPFSANNFAVAAIGVGTAAQTITPGTGWTNDVGTGGTALDPTTPAGLFAFGSMSQYLPTNAAITPSATIGGSEPWSMAVALFRPCLLGVTGTMHLSDGTNVAAVKAASTAAVAADPALTVSISPNTNLVRLTDNTTNTVVKAASTAAAATDPAIVVAVSPNNTIPTNISQVSASAVSTAATGVQKVGIVGNTGATIDAAVGTLPTNSQAHINVPSTGAGAALAAFTMNALTNSTTVKNSAGNLYGFMLQNSSTTPGFVQFFNTSSTTTTGAVIIIPIAASSTLYIYPGSQALLNFTTGICIDVATAVAGATFCQTITGTVFYK